MNAKSSTRSVGRSRSSLMFPSERAAAHKRASADITRQNEMHHSVNRRKTFLKGLYLFLNSTSVEDSFFQYR